MSDRERALLAEAGKIRALRERIVATAYLSAAEVRAHLGGMSRHTLATIPPEVLPWTPGPGKERSTRRYSPHDVAAYPARARRWRDAVNADRETEVLAEMRAEVEARDRALMDAALATAA